MRTRVGWERGSGERDTKRTEFTEPQLGPYPDPSTPGSFGPHPRWDLTPSPSRVGDGYVPSGDPPKTFRDL